MMLVFVELLYQFGDLDHYISRYRSIKQLKLKVALLRHLLPPSPPRLISFNAADMDKVRHTLVSVTLKVYASWRVGVLERSRY